MFIALLGFRSKHLFRTPKLFKSPNNFMSLKWHKFDFEKIEKKNFDNIQKFKL